MLPNLLKFWKTYGRFMTIGLIAFFLTYFYVQWTKAEHHLANARLELNRLTEQLLILNQQMTANDALIAELMTRNDELLKTYSSKRQTIKKAQQHEDVKTWNSQPVPEHIKRVLNR